MSLVSAHPEDVQVRAQYVFDLNVFCLCGDRGHDKRLGTLDVIYMLNAFNSIAQRACQTRHLAYIRYNRAQASSSPLASKELTTARSNAHGRKAEYTDAVISIHLMQPLSLLISGGPRVPQLYNGNTLTP